MKADRETQSQTYTEPEQTLRKALKIYEDDRQAWVWVMYSHLSYLHLLNILARGCVSRGTPLCVSEHELQWVELVCLNQI